MAYSGLAARFPHSSMNVVSRSRESPPSGNVAESPNRSIAAMTRPFFDDNRRYRVGLLTPGAPPRRRARSARTKLSEQLEGRRAPARVNHALTPRVSVARGNTPPVLSSNQTTPSLSLRYPILPARLPITSPRQHSRCRHRQDLRRRREPGRVRTRWDALPVANPSTPHRIDTARSPLPLERT